jgi:hypothetical protein
VYLSNSSVSRGAKRFESSPPHHYSARENRSGIRNFGESIRLTFAPFICVCSAGRRLTHLLSACAALLALGGCGDDCPLLDDPDFAHCPISQSEVISCDVADRSVHGHHSSCYGTRTWFVPFDGSGLDGWEEVPDNRVTFAPPLRDLRPSLPGGHPVTLPTPYPLQGRTLTGQTPGVIRIRRAQAERTDRLVRLEFAMRLQRGAL